MQYLHLPGKIFERRKLVKEKKKKHNLE
jgi:hypothetical protein